MSMPVVLLSVTQLKVGGPGAVSGGPGAPKCD